MCLVVLGWKLHPDYPLIVAGNRDEFHARPTESAHCWSDQPNIIGGRDLQAGGTWLALHRNGRFATVTNFRDADTPSKTFHSRGHLVTDFLTGNDTPENYLATIDGSKYAGFNLLASDGETLSWLSNRGDGVRNLAPGLYGLSNALLDSPWHKVVRAKRTFGELLDEDRINETELFRLLDDKQRAPASQIDSDRFPFESAHAISAPFIVLPDYGTRSSSVVLLDQQGSWLLHERRFDADGKAQGDSRFTFDT